MVDISTFYNTEMAAVKQSKGVSYERTNARPLDSSTVFESYTKAKDYALSNATAYPGQLVTVVDKVLSTSMVYVLDATYADGLKKIQSSDEGISSVVDLSVELYTSTDGLSSKLHTEVTTLRTDAFSNLSIDLQVQETPTSGSQRTYVLSQGANRLSTKIEIPQDRVVKSAYVVYVSAETSAYETFYVSYNNGEVLNKILSAGEDSYKLYNWNHDTSAWNEVTDQVSQVKERFGAIYTAYTDTAHGGEGSYIRMEVAGTEGTLNTPVVYIPVPGLANSYIGAETDTVSVLVEEGRSEQHRISALVKDGTIGERHLTTSLSNAIKDAMHFRGIGMYDGTLSNDATWSETSATLQTIPWYQAGNVAIAGDLVIKIPNESEYVFTDTGVWKEFGSGSEISAIKQSIETLRTDTTTAISQEATDRISVDNIISGLVENKVKVGQYGQTLQNQSQLSVIKIADEDYYRLVAEGKQDNNAIYIVSSDYVNGHDQRVINVGTAVSATDAVNLSVMQGAITAAKQEIVANALSGVRLNDQDFQVEGNVAILDISCIYCGSAE